MSVNQLNTDQLGKYLLKLRKSRDLSLDEMGSLLHVSGRTVRRWENAEVTPTMSDIINICNEFNISLDEFFAADSEPIISGDITGQSDTADSSSDYAGTKPEDKSGRNNLKIWIIVLLVLAITAAGCFYFKTHDLNISEESFKPESIGCHPELEGFNISVKSDGKTIIIAMFNNSNEDIDFIKSAYMMTLYRNINGQWHAVYQKQTPNFSLSPASLLRQGESVILVADCSEVYGRKLPIGTYRLVFSPEGLDSGRHTYIVEFAVNS